MSYLKETDEDLAVKERLWAATLKEIDRYVKWYLSEAVVGERYSDGQRDVTEAAKKKGYPKSLIREAASWVKRGLPVEDVCGGYKRKLFSPKRGGKL